jgi:hypothetical protein
LDMRPHLPPSEPHSSTRLRSPKSTRNHEKAGKKIYAALIVTTAFVSVVVSVGAQLSDGVKANVPFDFIVAHHTFHAAAITSRPM